ncbi:MAG: hypothetical protein M1837_006959 [Sclerophora amabilis]|nr:MAG: hypothetical protein M1837_006959 [Sclerophora amabilis]
MFDKIRAHRAESRARKAEYAENFEVLKAENEARVNRIRGQSVGEDQHHHPQQEQQEVEQHLNGNNNGSLVAGKLGQVNVRSSTTSEDIRLPPDYESIVRAGGANTAMAR